MSIRGFKEGWRGDEAFGAFIAVFMCIAILAMAALFVMFVILTRGILLAVVVVLTGAWFAAYKWLKYDRRRG